MKSLGINAFQIGFIVYNVHIYICILEEKIRTNSCYEKLAFHQWIFLHFHFIGNLDLSAM